MVLNRFESVTAIFLALIFCTKVGSAVSTGTHLPVAMRQGSITSLPCAQRIPILEELAANSDKEYMKAVSAELDLLALRGLMNTREKAAVQTYRSVVIRGKRLRDNKDELDSLLTRLWKEHDLNEDKAEAFRNVAAFNKKTLEEVLQKRDAAKSAADAAAKKKTISETRFGEAEEALNTPPFSPGELQKFTAAKEALFAARKESGKADAVLAEFRQQVKTLKGVVTTAETKVEVFSQNIDDIGWKIQKAEIEFEDIEDRLTRQKTDFYQAGDALKAVRRERTETIAKLNEATRKEREMKKKAEVADANLSKGRKDCLV